MVLLDEDEWKKQKRLLVLRSVVTYGDENINKTIDALRDPEYLAQKPRMRAFSERLAAALDEYKKGTDEGKNEYNRIITELSGKKHPTYRRLLAEHLNDSGCSFEISVNTPDLSRLVPANVQNKEAGYARVARQLNDYLEKNENNLSDNAKALFEKVITAYTKGDIVEIGNLKNVITNKEEMGAAFLIEKNRGYGIYAPRQEIILKSASLQQRQNSSQVAHPDQASQPEQNRLDDVRNSDQWNQVLTVGAQTAHNMASNLTEGIVITALKEVMGDKYPNNFADMTLDEQETVISSLNSAETAKVNVSILKKAQNLAEVLPPHFLTFMAKNVDKALEEKNISDDVKDALSTQKGVLLTSMFNQVISYKKGELTANPDNAAGVYDGTMEMLSYLEENINTIPENRQEALKQCIEYTRKELEEAIDTYDENNGLKDVTKDDTKKIEKAYDALTKHVEEILSKDEFEKSLDADTLDIFKKLEFPVTKDKDGNDISAEENKKLFIDMVLHSAAQKAAVEAKDKKGDELAEAFKTQLQETVVLETIKLIQAEESVKMAQDQSLADSLRILPNDSGEEKRNKLKQYIQGLGDNTCKVSSEAFAGYAAAKVCQQSLFLNRLATKTENRGSSLLKKMWKPFEKIDQTCIKRFGKTYTAAKSLVKGNLQNLPWSFGNAVARTAAFAQLGTPWGLAAVAGYGVFSLGTTTFRMVRQYKKMKKQDPSMTAGKFFKNNWSGMALSLVGTAVSVVPGLSMASNIGWLNSAMDVMRDSGALNVSVIPGASHLGMTNASVGLIGAGLIDSTVRGTIAHRKNGDGLLAAFCKSLGYASASSALGVATGIGCSMLANEVLPNQHMNTAGDVRNPEIEDSSFDKDNPDHYKENISPREYDPDNPSHAKAPLTEDQLGIGTENDLTELSPEELAEKGLVREPARADEAGAFCTKEAVEAYTTHDYSSAEHEFAEMRNSDPRYSEFLEEYHVAPDLQDSTDPGKVSPTATDNLSKAIEELAASHTEMQTDNGDGTTRTNTQMLMYKLTQMAYLAPNGDALTTDGVTVGEAFGHTASDGSHTSYMDILKEGINTGTFSDPEAAFEILSKIEDHVGGQLDNQVNDMGKVDMFGNDIKSGRSVNSYQENDAGYDTNYHKAVEAEYEKISQFTRARETLYMPTNPSIDLYNIAAGEGMAKIMGQNGQRKNNEVNRPIDARNLPNVSDETTKTSSDGGMAQTSGNGDTSAQSSGNEGISTQTPAKKGNIFSRFFKRGGKDGK